MPPRTSMRRRGPDYETLTTQLIEQMMCREWGGTGRFLRPPQPHRGRGQLIVVSLVMGFLSYQPRTLHCPVKYQRRN